MTWATGKQLDNCRYTINLLLKRNDFITTYLAQDGNGDRVIIKTLDGSYFLTLPPAERSGVETRFEQGSMILYQCGSSHLVSTPRQPFQ